MSEGPTNFIAEAITEAFGERCPEVAEGCPCCDAWAQYDQIADVLKQCDELGKVAEKMTGCRSDDEYVWGIQAKVAAAIRSLGRE